MLPILAQMEVPAPAANDFMMVLGCVVLMVMLLNQALNFYKNHIKAADPVPPLDHKYATKEKVELLEKSLTVLEEEIEADERANALAGSQSREKIYSKLEELGHAIASLKKENELNNQWMRAIEQKLDRLIERRP